MDEGDTWLMLNWKPPVDGGAVAAYAILRRDRDGGKREDVSIAVGTQQLVSDQPRRPRRGGWMLVARALPVA